MAFSEARRSNIARPAASGVSSARLRYCDSACSSAAIATRSALRASLWSQGIGPPPPSVLVALGRCRPRQEMQGQHLVAVETSTTQLPWSVRTSKHVLAAVHGDLGARDVAGLGRGEKGHDPGHLADLP